MATRAILLWNGAVSLTSSKLPTVLEELEHLQWLYLQYLTYDPVHEISNNVVYATIKALDQHAHMHSLIRSFASRLSIL